MKKSFLLVLLFVLPLTATVCFPQEEMLLDLLENPGDFLFNLHSDNADFTPVLKNRHGTIRTNFYPTTLPGTWLNLSVKAKVLSESGFASWVPQVDLVAEYGNMLAIEFAASAGDVGSSTGTTKPGINGMAYGIVVTKAIAEKTRIFSGIRISNAGLNVKFSEPMDVGGSSFSEFNVAIEDTLLVTGIENQLGKNKYVIAHLCYSYTQKKIVARIGWYSKRSEIGFNIYPEGFMVMHPFLAWHWYF